ncbi:non-homologous end joining protein Ku [Priestia abyssalis]|uniref:non-homologous end joining protein Ku n=1 Tax=Priestia abyssalis TaxID=1221450 RepID=UPI001473E546|nr:Ku protein [Priestia abyssalis]
MLHTVWKGKLNFGLIDVPVRLHSAIDDVSIKLRTIHKICHTPIQYEKMCPSCGREVNNDETMKGYETSSGKFIPITDKEIENLKKPFEEEKDIRIMNFVHLDEVDPLYFDRSYFLSPSEGGKRAYSLLHEALSQSKRAGFAKLFLHSDEKLALIRPYKEAIVMETLHYHHEIRDIRDVPNLSAAQEVSPQDLQLTKTLLEELTSPFQPEHYKNEYQAAFTKFIEQKLEQKETITLGHEPAPKNVANLMAALKASLDYPIAPPDQNMKKREIKRKEAF